MHLGYIIEPFMVQLNGKGECTLTHQKLCVVTANDFAKFLDETDLELIKLLEGCDQEFVAKKYHKEAVRASVFFEKFYTPKVKELVRKNIEQRVVKALSKLQGKKIFWKAKDGNPTQTEFKIAPLQATVLFHFIRNNMGLRYYPTIKYDNVRIEFMFKNALIISANPGWMLLNNTLYSFDGDVDGRKLLPFLNKRYIEVPKTSEADYFKKFVIPLIEQYHVHAEGFEIKTEKYRARPLLKIETVWTGGNQLLLSFRYGGNEFPYKSGKKVSVTMESEDDHYIFNRIRRAIDWENSKAQELIDLGLIKTEGAGFSIKQYTGSNAVLGAAEGDRKYEILDWINANYEQLTGPSGFEIIQPQGDKKYVIASSTLNIEIKENNDWFDVHAIVRFGEHEVPFIQLRNYILKGNREFILPGGLIALIPETWFAQLRELFIFSENSEEIKLKKHHLGYVNALKVSNIAEISMTRKLEQLLEFEGIDEAEFPLGLQGELRPYQKAGYDWFFFLKKYNFGGCLADDMGLGKTVQTLTLLQKEKEEFSRSVVGLVADDGATLQEEVYNTSLIIMPTSLIYNWLNEAKKFTPHLRVLVYSGGDREKDVAVFANYDVVLTSYGLARIDEEILQKYYFNYIILDESQCIKNASSQTARAVKTLKSKHRLLLSGTPIENSITDLWSQMTFANPGLLGSFSYFKEHYVIPIEKDKDEQKKNKLYALIKPFILRRTKKQVADDLPEKVEQVFYCEMTEAQREIYDETKSSFRNEIIKTMDTSGLPQSKFSLLAGLVKLRQIANHPGMVDPEYTGESGKFNEVLLMIENALAEGHKMLIFSQFVKQLSIYRKHFDKEGIPYSYLDGSVRNRQPIIDEFQTNEEIKIFLISLKVGGVGLNLTAADYVFILDPWWNPAVEQQAIDRTHRIGQKNTVFTYKFITRDTVEEKILKLQQRKSGLSQNLITTEDSFIKSLSEEDIRAIFD